jgi:hypothetical protein
MDARLKSLVTLAGLGLLLIVAATWGWSSLTQPFPEGDGDAICVDRPYAAGDRISRGDVTVSVLNAGTRNGLAGLTMNLFEEAGFAPGQEGNAPEDAKVGTVQIWTEDRTAPAVRLVASHLGKDVRVVRRAPSTAGIQVVVGDGFEDLVAGKKSIRTRGEVTVCGPPTDAVG